MTSIANSAESSNASASLTAWLNHINAQRNAFMCARCKKTFPTTHALGGHQNAHRRERNEERRLTMEERRLKAIEDTPILCPTPLMVAPPSKGGGQIVDYLAKPDGSGSGQSPSMPWSQPALSHDDEFVGDNIVNMCAQIPYGAGHGHDEINYRYYLKYFCNPKPKPKEQDLFKRKELIALSTGQGGVWFKECLPALHVTEKDETSRAFNGVYYEAEVVSNGGLDLTLKL